MSTPTPPPQFDVTGSFESPSAEPNRAGKFDVYVTYRIQGDPMFQGSVRVPKEASSVEQIKTAIRADYKEKQQLRGFSFS